MSYNSMQSKRKLLQAPLAIAEDVKLQLMAKVDAFMQSDEESYTFPASLTKTERMFLHGYTVQKGVNSQSVGHNGQRQLTIFRAKSHSEATNNTKQPTLSKLQLSSQSKKSMYRCFSNLPRKNPNPNSDQKKDSKGSQNSSTRTQDRRQFGMSTLTNGVACVPPTPAPLEPSLASSRRALPIFESRQSIIDTIAQNQVIILVGETGSGKTTQVPQYLLENATATNTNCRIVCTQPRRLSALSVADRVAFERNEETGGTVGFQIRLESRTCPRSNLIYCTNGILVRCLMTGEHQETFRNITHIILDEVHERDKNADFLLITIRDVLKLNPRLKLILMSATIDTSLFAKYFNDCPQIFVPGRTFSVQELFLEDILRLTKFKKHEVETLFEKKKKRIGNKEKEPTTIAEEVKHQGKTQPTMKKKRKPVAISLDADTERFVNELLERCLKEDFQENFDQFIFMVEAEEVSIDFQHAETQLTALMIAATRGCADVVETLLTLNADAEIKTSHGFTALDLALNMNNEDCAELLRRNKVQEEESSTSSIPPPSPSTAATSHHPEPPPGGEPSDSSEYVDILLDVYNNSFNATVAVDRFLILDLIEFIHHQMPTGSILVFLPGYEDITQLNNMVMERMNERKLKPNLRLYTLHSNMKVSDQKAVFKPAPFGCRKIILSTNIAETSITIDDVVYVIDCGKVKQTNFDVHTGTNCLETVPISRACSKQRAGRAGRVTSGLCYRLYSRKQYEWMAEFTVPELLRVPLTDICLAAKLISPHEKIPDFLAKAVTPPLRKCIQRSVELLKKIGALEEEEKTEGCGEVITNLGMVLADLPVDAHLGKMIIYAIILKCVDPILTIVSALSVKSVFTLPMDKRGKEDARELRLNLAEGSMSDHLVMIRVFQKWLEHSSRRSSEDFCRQFYLNGGSLQTICGMRSLILGHLRANRLIKSNGKGNIHDLNANAKNWAVVKACLVAGLYPNVCERTMRGARYFLRGEMRETIYLHTQSVLKGPRNAELDGLCSDWIVFEEKVRSAGQAAAIDCNTMVSASTIAMFAGNLSLGEECIHVAEKEEEDMAVDNWDDVKDDQGEQWEDEKEEEKESQESVVHMKINKWITLQLEEESAVGLLELRRLFNELLLRMLNGHENFHAKLDANDNLIIATIAEVLAAEDRALGMVQPKGVGDRPQAVHLDFSADINFGIHESISAATSQPVVECEVTCTSTTRDMGRMSIGGRGFNGGNQRRSQWSSSSNSRGGGLGGPVQSWRNNQDGGEGGSRDFLANNNSRGNYNSQQMNGGGGGRRGRGAQAAYHSGGRGGGGGGREGDYKRPQPSPKRYFIVRTETRNEAMNVLQGHSFYPLEFAKRELSKATAGHQAFVIIFNVHANKEFFGCAVLDPRTRTGNKLVVEKVSVKSLWHSCYKGWNAAMDADPVRELSASDGEFLYSYFKGK